MNPASKSIIPASFDHLLPVRKVIEQVPVIKKLIKPEVRARRMPKTRANLDPNRVKLQRTPWTTVQLAKLIELRADKVSDKECGKILGRTAKSCRMAIWGRGLMPEIRARRLEIAKDTQNGKGT
jgi:hypothetical protein